VNSAVYSCSSVCSFMINESSVNYMHTSETEMKVLRWMCGTRLWNKDFVELRDLLGADVYRGIDLSCTGMCKESTMIIG